MSGAVGGRILTVAAGVAALALCLVGAPRPALLLGVLGVAGYAAFLVLGRSAAATVGSVAVVLAAAVGPAAGQHGPAGLSRMAGVAALLVAALLAADAAETLPRGSGWRLLPGVARSQVRILGVAVVATVVTGMIAERWSAAGPAYVLAGMALTGCAMWLASRQPHAPRT